MMFELVALGVIVFLGVTFEVLFSIRIKVLSILNATPIHTADTQPWFEKNSLHTFRNSRLRSCTASFVLHRKQWSFITHCPTDLLFLRWSSGRINLDWIQTDLCDCSFDYKKCFLFTEVPAINNFSIYVKQVRSEGFLPFFYWLPCRLPEFNSLKVDD